MKSEVKLKTLSSKILAFIVYTFIVLFAGWNIRKKYEPKPTLIASSESTKDNKLKSHLKGTYKKKSDVKTGVVEEQTDFEMDLDLWLKERKSLKTVQRSEIKPDNLKFPVNSKAQLGVEIMPFDHHWIGYIKDTKTNEDVYQYSYSTRVF